MSLFKNYLFTYLLFLILRVPLLKENGETGLCPGEQLAVHNGQVAVLCVTCPQTAGCVVPSTPETHPQGLSWLLPLIHVCCFHGAAFFALEQSCPSAFEK